MIEPGRALRAGLLIFGIVIFWARCEALHTPAPAFCCRIGIDLVSATECDRMNSHEKPPWPTKLMPSRKIELRRFRARMNSGVAAVALLLAITPGSIVGLSLLALSTTLTGCANRDNIPPLFYASRTLQEQQQQTQSAAQLALYDYEHNINPEWNVPISGLYDQADRYRGPNGFPLPGWKQMFFGR